MASPNPAYHFRDQHVVARVKALAARASAGPGAHVPIRARVTITMNDGEHVRVEFPDVDSARMVWAQSQYSAREPTPETLVAILPAWDRTAHRQNMDLIARVLPDYILESRFDARELPGARFDA